MDGWSTEFPTEPGKYWFYGYRWGKVSLGKRVKPHMWIVDAYKFLDSFNYVVDGHFMRPKEVECPHFKKVDFPEHPEIKD